MQQGLPLPQQPGRVEAVESHLQALPTLAPGQLKAKIIPPVVRQPQELQHPEVKIKQARLAVQNGRVLGL